jgi:GNAT superfamily N-acetyltransferase
MRFDTKKKIVSDTAYIHPADGHDVVRILEWLADEREKTGEGFYVNGGIIAGAARHIFEEPELFVLIDTAVPEKRWFDLRANTGEDAGEIVGFIVLPADIVCVHPDHRGRLNGRKGKGYGTYLGKFMIDRAKAAGLKELEVECAPIESREFWPRLGFQPIEGSWSRMRLDLT